MLHFFEYNMQMDMISGKYIKLIFYYCKNFLSWLRISVQLSVTGYDLVTVYLSLDSRMQLYSRACELKLKAQ